MRHQFATGMLATLTALMLVPGVAADECALVECLAGGDVEGSQQAVDDSVAAVLNSTQGIVLVILQFADEYPGTVAGSIDAVTGLVNTTMVFFLGDIWSDPDGWALWMATEFAPAWAEENAQGLRDYAVSWVEDANRTATGLGDSAQTLGAALVGAGVNTTDALHDAALSLVDSAQSLAGTMVEFAAGHANGTQAWVIDLADREAAWLTNLTAGLVAWAEDQAGRAGETAVGLVTYAVGLGEQETAFLAEQVVEIVQGL